MGTFNRFTKPQRRHSGAADKADARILPGGEFVKTIEYERRRTERSEQPFSLIVLRFGKPRTSEEATSPASEHIARRLRAVDKIGCLPGGDLGILTPYTKAPSAKTLADLIVADLPKVALPASIDIYEYPPELPPPSTGKHAESQSGAAPLAPQTGIESLLSQPMPFWKRAIDVLGALIGMLLLAPLLAATAIAVKLSSSGPIFFVQRRTGRGGRPFWIYKFRTMVADAERRKPSLLPLSEQDGPAFKIDDDPRITPFGRWLRKTSVDEIPQLWNVLRGEMSLVGPRPLPCDESDRSAAWQRRRLDVTPGMTCIWQVNDRTRKISFARWMRMDLQYIKTMSLRQDLALLLKTVWFVLGRRGS